MFNLIGYTEPSQSINFVRIEFLASFENDVLIPTKNLYFYEGIQLKGVLYSVNDFKTKNLTQIIILFIFTSVKIIFFFLRFFYQQKNQINSKQTFKSIFL